MYKDIEKKKAAKRKHYEANKDKILSRTKERSQKRRDSFKQIKLDYLKSHPCIDCGETDPIVLEFDHITGEKKFNIARAGSVISNIESFKEEIAKCEVRCANCHRRVTALRRIAARERVELP